jgi:protoheme IX farnesyltransferase
VMSLVIFTGFVGMFLAPADMHPLLFIISLFAIAAGAGASGAINQWYDRDIDAVMERTRRRPVPSGAVEPAEALSFGLVISTLSVLLLGLAANWLAAGLLAFTIFFYGVIYTIWLKRSTPQNIVIGGAAGALPPVIGWAAVTGGLSIEPLILFAVIFMWTPPHFWALALFRNDDYRRANVPMMPVVAGEAETRRQILIYALLLAPLALVPALIGMTSMAYGIVAAALGLNFVRLSWMLYRRSDDAAAKRLFAFSILYLFLLFLGLVIDRALVKSGLLAVL